MSAASPVPRRKLQAVPPPKTKSLDDYVQDWRAVDSELQSNLWELARIAASLTTRYGQSDIEAFAQKVGRAPSYVYNVAATHREFGNSTRVENLSFTHYRTAVRAKNPQAAIRLASERGMSTRDLSTWIDEQTAEEKKKLQRRKTDNECADERQKNGVKRREQARRWQELGAMFPNFTDEQLIAYALVVCSRTSDALHMEAIEMVTEIDDLLHYIGERKYQLKFRDAA